MIRALIVVVALALSVTPAAAQPSVDALRVFLGVTGATCAMRSGTGAPASGLGSVCDTYWRKDAPYTVYQKTGASTWSELVTLPGSSGITTVGALTSGSIASGFGAINIGNPITGTTLTGSSVVSPSLTTSSNMTITPAGDLIFAPAGLDVLPDTGYTKNLGALNRKFLSLHAAELWVETLVAQNTIATIGGRILVGPTTVLTADLTSGSTSIEVKHNQMVSGDRVYMEANGSLEWMAITSGPSGSGPYTYSVTRNLDGTGANQWSAGDALFNTGQTGKGFIDLFSTSGVLSGSGPSIVGSARTGTAYNAIAPRWAIGNLNGTFGYGSDVYGAAFGDASAAWLKIDPTNGVRLGNGGTTTLQIDSAGNASFVSGAIGITSAGLGIDIPNTGAGDSARAYRFNAASGTMQMQGHTNVADTSRYIEIVNSASGTGFLNLTSLEAGNGNGFANVVSRVGSGAITTTLLANTGTPQSLEVNADGNITVSQTGALVLPDLNIFANNGATTAKPYYRSDGNYMVLESRSTANGGALYLNNDTNAAVVIAFGGGGSILYNASFANVGPNWASGLAQTTVGAAGPASALPATPVGYLKVYYAGVPYVIPAYTP